MAIVLRRNEVEVSSVLKKIEVEGEVDEGREVIVCCETGPPKWKGFESLMILWTKTYERI